MNELLNALKKNRVRINLTHYRTNDPFSIEGTLMKEVCGMDIDFQAQSDIYLIYDDVNETWLSFKQSTVTSYEIL